ncbi:hypothetical protein MTP99_002347 [Tenebrio molitor]|jgi:hypothetical protein|nr:hypothetical protein MTP99_002347 [Tenebrio molitor]CAH1378517.1 unnamed protein product [Tenebrio molitor]
MPHAGPHKKPKFMNNILDEIFHPQEPICQIIKTSSVLKPDIFELFRPKSKTCLDYNISQTDMKLDAGNTKIHIQQTEASYVPDEKPPPPPRRYKKRKIKYFSGGPPQWEFVDEKWRREQEEKQKIYRQQLQERLEKQELEKIKKKRKVKNNLEKCNH